MSELDVSTQLARLGVLKAQVRALPRPVHGKSLGVMSYPPGVYNSWRRVVHDYARIYR
jgi:hypothetical protein